MTHYELFFLYVAGFNPKSVIKLFRYSPGVAYRGYRNFRKAQKKAASIIRLGNSGPLKREKKLNTLDH